MTARTQQGVALISVLWIILLVSTIATSLSATVRTDSRIARRAIQTSQVEHLARGGIDLAVYNMQIADVSGWRADGIPRDLSIENITLRIAITDESGRVDINQAPVELLQSLFAALGEDVDRSATLANTIVDFRDSDDLRMPLGAERSDYLADGRTVGPRNSDFEVTGELQNVMGMDAEIYARLQPHVTVHTGAVGVNRNLASAQVAQAIAGLGQLEGGQGGQFLRISVQASDQDGAVAQLEAVVDLMRTPQGQVYRVLELQTPRNRLFVASAGALL